MFALRRIDSRFGETNTSLGEYYTLLSKEHQPEQFNETVKLWDKDVVDKLGGVIVFNDGESIMPLYIGVQYYIMYYNGSTYSSIKY